ncbi:MAG: alpha-glucan family phosphorylase [Planctomycetota bacterium]|jgi:alpha-glucan phosphorylase-like protein
MKNTAYFCAEFALDDRMPIYSGGLGVLAGDHLKSANDLGLPLIAVGLRYEKGYFRQRIEPDGTQFAQRRSYDTRDTPLHRLPLILTIPMDGREVYAGAWRLDVGEVPLYLLDTYVKENEPEDRLITERLYPAEREPRLRQEILLGMGGWKLLRALDRIPEICHLNEGHSAFLLLERLLELVEGGTPYAEAVEFVRSTTVFTTHTPVPAGHDSFSEDLMRAYFTDVARRLGLSWEQFMELGEEHPDKDTEFSMTALALKLCSKANGVSRKHGEVARDMHAGVGPEIAHITNGVHLPTWCGPEMRSLFDRNLGGLHGTDWGKIIEVPDDELWAARHHQKQRLCINLREEVERTGLRRRISPDVLAERLDGIDEDALWICFARRFATYKRATLLFEESERLAALLNDPLRPVRIVFAGKAHPADGEGSELIRQIVEHTARPEFLGKIFFVEDYRLAIAQWLVAGADVWLNTPTPPMEASGTSGMKACLNGGLHLSVFDGWWCEGFDDTNGWVIDDESLHSTLENDVVPLFFEHDERGLPPGWLEMMKRCLATIPGEFSTRRMVSDYVRFAYGG